MEKKVGIIIGIATLAIFGVAIVFLSKPTEDKKTVNLVRGGEIVRGKKGAENQIVEFTDYECPACASEADVLKELLQKYPNRIELSLRHMPIPGHKWSKLLAKAVEAAGKQGKFWEMNDEIFAKRDEWLGKEEIKDYVLEMAGNLGIDKDKFLIDWESKEVETKVTQDFNDGVILGVSSTPTLFVNGKKISGDKSLSDWENLLKLN